MCPAFVLLYYGVAGVVACCEFEMGEVSSKHRVYLDAYYVGVACVIKQALADYGAVHASYYHSDSFYKEANPCLGETRLIPATKMTHRLEKP